MAVLNSGAPLGQQYWIPYSDAIGGEHYELLSLHFWHYGSSVLDLAGQTFDIRSLISSSPGPFQEAWVEHDDPDLRFSERLTGSVRFGDANAISDWYLYTYVGYADESVHWSAPRAVDASSFPFNHLEDPEPYAGISLYGWFSSEVPDYFYLTNPGRWSTSVERLCYIAGEGSRTPCQDAAPPPNGCGPDGGGVPPDCDPLAPVPLPPSLLLLASGLLGVGTLRRRRTRPADYTSGPCA